MIHELNYFQRQVGYQHAGNHVISAPTGSGKTYAVELLVKDDLYDGTVIIAVPTNALVAQHNKSFAHYVDYAPTVLTYEALLILARNNRLPVDLKTVVIDECHMLGDRQRGALLEEAIIRSSTARIILLSGSLLEKNVWELQRWLTRLNGLATATTVSGWRPYETKLQVVNYEPTGNYLWDLENGFKQLLYLFAATYTPTKSFVVFVHDKGRSFQVAKQAIIDSSINPKVIWEYHATLPEEQKQLIVDSFRPGDVLITTSALEVGTDLAIDVGFCVGTDSYARGRIDNTTIQQMQGRVGRRVEGVFYVITTETNRDFTKIEPIQSQMYERDALRFCLCDSNILAKSLSHVQGITPNIYKIRSIRSILEKTSLTDLAGNLRDYGRIAYQYAYNPWFILSWVTGIDAFRDVKNHNLQIALILANAPDWGFTYIPQGRLQQSNIREFVPSQYRNLFPADWSARRDTLQKFTAFVVYLILSGVEMDEFPEVKWFVDRFNGDQSRLFAVLKQLGEL